MLCCVFSRTRVWSPLFYLKDLKIFSTQLGEHWKNLKRSEMMKRVGSEQLRIACTVLANLLNNYEYHTVEEWEQSLSKPRKTPFRVFVMTSEAAKEQYSLSRAVRERIVAKKIRQNQHLLELHTFKKRLRELPFDFQEEEAE